MNWINDKLFILPINTYIDPYKPVENAIITHAHADHAKPGHKNVLATKETIDIMKLRYGVNCAESFQVLDYNEKLIIDEVEITLYPAGHILGSAQVLVEYKGEKINFTGDFKTTYDTTCENFEKVECDILVTEATFGLPIFKHPHPKFEIEKLFRSLNFFPKRPHLIGVYALGKAQRLIKLIRDYGYDKTIFIHGSLEKICEYYEYSKINLGKLSKTSFKNNNEFKGNIILAPPSALRSKWSRQFSDPIISHASGWMSIKQRAKQSLVELPLIISDHADWNELTQNILDSEANKVFITHGRHEGLETWCKQREIAAFPLALSHRSEEGNE